MKQGTDMKINRLPVRTWNWLRMNESSLSAIDIEALLSARENPSDGPALTLPEDGVSCIRGMSAGMMEAGFREIATGMGPDMEELVKESGTPVEIIRVKKGERPEPPVKLIYSCGEGESSLHAAYIYAEEGSRVTVIMDVSSPGGAGGTAGFQTRLYAEKGAGIRLIQVQLLGTEYGYINDVGGTCEEGGSLELVQLFLGARSIYAGSSVNLAGDRSRMDTAVGYLGKKDQKLDMNYVAGHTGKKTESRMEVKGVLRENASKLFRGTIDFRRGCAGAVGEETEEVLLLGDEVVNRTIPLILCGEENVQGSHGATAGRLEEEKLFYFCSRGMSREEACDMMARAGIDALCGRIPDAALVEKVQDFLEGGARNG